MSEETRRNRKDEIHAIDAIIDALRSEIESLEDRIAALRLEKPPELPEDREWRLAQMTPGERALRALWPNMKMI